MSATNTSKNVGSSSSTNPFAKSSFSVLLSVAGIFTVATALGLQFYNVDHGSSGQLTIDSRMKGVGWVIALGLIITFVGLVLYRTIQSSERAFLWLFAFAWVGYLIANFAVLLSLYQVQLTQT
jgi:hypothetical protein